MRDDFVRDFIRSVREQRLLDAGTDPEVFKSRKATRAEIYRLVGLCADLRRQLKSEGELVARLHADVDRLQAYAERLESERDGWVDDLDGYDFSEW